MYRLVAATDGAARLRVTATAPVADGILALTLADEHGRRLPAWTPGAHLDLFLGNGAVRQYSLCGDRADPFRYRVAVLREPAGRGGSAYVHDELRPGDLLGYGGPRNAFPLVPAPHYRFVAGGIGITPILPMLAQAQALGADWTLDYAGRGRRSMAFLGELTRYGDRVRIHAGDERARLDVTGVVAGAGPVYCCGPAPLLAAVTAACADRPPGFLRTERFAAADGGPTRGAPFVVRLARSGRAVTVPADDSVLDALRRDGVPLLSSCRQGVCGTCEVGVLAGRVDHRDSLLDDDERRQGTCMFACVSRAYGDQLVLDL
jgi:ferredoxin-NADP reductase